MVNQELLAYIKQQVQLNVAEDAIRNELLTKGWAQADIDSAFQLLHNPQAPTPPNDSIYYAGFWIRWVANFIDGFVIGIGNQIIITISSLLLYALGLPDVAIFVASITLSFAITFIYFVWLTYTKGATLGKMAVGIKVISVDNNRLTLGKVVMREIVGKILSTITLFVGYLMVAFTAKKQGLHDIVAGSVVVYKDHTKKINAWVIAVIVCGAIFFAIAILGILSSVVLASLNSARMKGNDAAVKSTVSTVIVESLVYANQNDSFSGFIPTSNTNAISCSEPLTVNVSEDRKALAVFGKSCVDDTTYYCKSVMIDGESSELLQTVPQESVTPGKTTCE